MKISSQASISSAFIAVQLLRRTQAIEPTEDFVACSANMVAFQNPSGEPGDCVQLQAGQNATYPSGFSIKNAVAHFVCPKSDVRIIISNGIPNHFIEQENPNYTCEVDWFVQVPLHPKLTNQVSEPSDDGIVAMSLNGIPGFGAQELGAFNAMFDDPSNPAADARNWWGHSDGRNQHHYHNPKFGRFHEVPARILKGFALDGFPVYGPVRDPSKLDKCNGRVGSDGKYRYHTRSPSQVNATAPYCDGNNPWINWNYILGCYHGDMSRTVVGDFKQNSIPSDCTLVERYSFNANLLNITFPQDHAGHEKEKNEEDQNKNGPGAHNPGQKPPKGNYPRHKKQPPHQGRNNDRIDMHEKNGKNQKGGLRQRGGEKEKPKEKDQSSSSELSDEEIKARFHHEWRKIRLHTFKRNHTWSATNNEANVDNNAN